ncbi:WD40-repeat-containing domain protein [Ilyonectria destructans]|nr:WD40-repeat-containing domain protein [Ilyonectria destructans]
MSSSEPRDPRDPPIDGMDEILDADDVAEEIPEDGDLAMDSDDDGYEETTLENNSIAYFDKPPDSLFSIAQHPVHPSLIAVGGSAGRKRSDGGVGWVFDTSVIPQRPVLPASYASDPAAASEALKNTELEPLFSIGGHTDSINTLAWTLPRGEVLVSGGLDGRLRAWKATVKPGSPFEMDLIDENHEVTEINWIEPCPSPAHPNTIAVGTSIINKKYRKESKYSVYVYTIDLSNSDPGFKFQASYHLHDDVCTAGAWTPDGLLLATVSKNSSLYVWDVWGKALAQGLVKFEGQPVFTLTKEDQRFNVKGGLYSIAVDPNGAFIALVGPGLIKIITLPRLAAQPQNRSRGARGKASVKPTAGGETIGSIKLGDGSIESLSVTVASVAPPTTLLAAGSTAGSIAVYETNRFSPRRVILSAHDDHAIVKVKFIPNTWQLTSCGTDGAVRRWDFRGSGTTTQDKSGMLKEWKGHHSDDDIQGVMGFVHGETGEQVVTVGDDGVSLVFRT